MSVVKIVDQVQRGNIKYYSFLSNYYLCNDFKESLGCSFPHDFWAKQRGKPIVCRPKDQFL